MRLFTVITICALTLTLFPSGVFAQSTRTHSLSVDTSTVTPGQSVTVTWQTPNTPNRTDWVGLYRVGTSDNSYIAYQYVDLGTQNISFTLSTTGDYEFRYFLNNGYTRVATSPTVTVTSGGGSGGNGSYSISVDTTNLTAGQSVKVTWQTPSSPHSTDWIGLFQVGTANTNYIAYQYVRGSNLNFTIQTPGDYEFRYFTKNSYNRAANSPTVTVTGGGGSGGGTGSYSLSLSATDITTDQPVTVSWQTPGTPGITDWVGLYKVGVVDSAYLSYQYIQGTSRTFTIHSAGDYEFRYFLNNGYTRVATSPTVTVTSGGGSGGNGSYSLTTDKTTYNINDTARVTWSAPRYQLYDWIGLYRIGDPNASYLAFEYTDFLSDTETFTLRSPGAYEFRFFTKNSYDLVATSPQVTVSGSTGNNPLCTYNITNITNLPTGNGPIIALGDSLTFGTGATSNQNYVDELEKRLNVNIINEGIPGDTTVDALARLNRDVLSHDPSTVIVFLGGNDELRRIYDNLSNTAADRQLETQLDTIAANLGYDWQSVPLVSEQETFTNLITIINRIQNNGAAVIVVGFNASIFNQNLNARYQTVANDTNSLFVSDIYNGVFGRPSLMSDLVHPNNAGYDVFASRIVPALACTL